MHEKFSKRFAELENEAINFPIESIGNYQHVPDGKWQKWCTSVQSLLLAVYRQDSPQYNNFLKAYKSCHGNKHEIDTLLGIFLSAKEDFDGGYVFNVDMEVSGEVFGDLVSLAKQSLSEGYKDVAAVLACAALEDALKRYARVNKIDVEDKDMQEVINALKAKSLVSGAQKSILESMPKFRNAAMHADWDKIDSSGVGGVIGFVEQFLLTKFVA
ncbi:MAG: DUF4145 domain-containing protein [bacterium]